jgi:GT2 family glycosyltransferase
MIREMRLATYQDTIDTFDPVLVGEAELARPLEIVTNHTNGSVGHDRALVTVRLHGVPLGRVEVELEGGTIKPATLAGAIREELADAIRAHLLSDGVELPQALTESGIPGVVDPVCVRARQAFLAGDPPHVDVIVPSRERPQRLERCLRAILACEYPSDRRKIFVVDNVPTSEATRALVEREFRDEVVYVREDVLGSATARNTGVGRSSAPIVAFTDDDVVVDRWWLAEIAHTYAAVPAAGAVTGLLLPLELETRAQAWFEEYGGFSRGYELRLFDLEEHRDDSPLYPFNAGLFGTGNSMSFRRGVLESIGGFDPALGNGTPARGGVDTEVLLRTVLKGHTIAYQPRALAYHAHRREYDALYRQLHSYGIGLTATFTKILVTQPSVIPMFLRRLPAGIRFAVSPTSGKNSRKRLSYPAELTRAELRGMLYGPVAYFLSRRHLRRLAASS